jgi:dienelactone hydrolase
LFPDETREFGDTYLTEASGVHHEFKTYKGVPHGFAVVGEYEAANIKEAQAEAYQQMLAWLKAH